MARQFPKYEPTPTSTAETPAAVPELQICKINNGQLHLPPDVRAQFMGDPVRSAEWKRLLAEFDRKWSTSSSGESGRSTDAAVEQIVAAEGDGDGESGQQDEEPRGSCCESAFVGEPTTKEDMEAKYTTAHSFPMADNLVGVIVEGPKLFVSSLGDVQWSVDEPFLCFGAGTWLLDDKAASYLEVPWMFFQFHCFATVHFDCFRLRPLFLNIILLLPRRTFKNQLINLQLVICLKPYHLETTPLLPLSRSAPRTTATRPGSSSLQMICLRRCWRTK